MMGLPTALCKRLSVRCPTFKTDYLANHGLPSVKRVGGAQARAVHERSEVEQGRLRGSAEEGALSPNN